MGLETMQYILVGDRTSSTLDIRIPGGHKWCGGSVEIWRFASVVADASFDGLGGIEDVVFDSRILSRRS